MKTKILSLLVILAIAVASCQKDEADKPVVLQDVTFGIEHIDPLGLKNDEFDIVCPDDLVPVKAHAVISYLDEDDNLVTENFYPLAFFLNGKWYTQAIKLAPGEYTIEEFYLLDANDDVIMATPAKGSVYEVYVEEGVDIDFTVVEFTKIEIPIDVLCYEPARFDEFGFFWFQVDRIVVRTFCFFGDICANGEPYEPADFANTAYASVPGGLQVDMPAIFEIRAFDSDDNPLPYSPFSNLGEENAPLCVEYPDNIDVAGETFTFELWVMGPDGTYTLYHTFTVTDDQIDITDIDEDDVIEFVIGNCNYSATDLQLAWPAATVMDFIPFYIRNSNGTITAPWDTNMDITENAAGDGFSAVTPSGGQKVGYGTNFFDGVKINSIHSLFYNDIALPAPGVRAYMNLWVTDGTNYAIISSEDAYLGTDFLTRQAWKVFETDFGNLNWLFDSGVGGRDGAQYLTRDGVRVTFADFSDNIILQDPGVYNPPIGTGAPRGGYGFQLVFGDTQANFTGGPFSMDQLTVTVNGITYNAEN